MNHQLIDTMGIQKLYMGLAWVAALVLVCSALYPGRLGGSFEWPAAVTSAWPPCA